VNDDDTLTAVLNAFRAEMDAVQQFATAQDLAADLIEARVDDEVICRALDEMFCRMEANRRAYRDLDRLLHRAGWVMERWEELPPAFREALDAQIPAQRDVVRRTAHAEAIIGTWLDERERERAAWRYHQARQRTETAHSRRARRRRGED
jgi:hypothetical protein